MSDGLLNMVESAIEGIKEYFQDFANRIEGEIPNSINDITENPPLEARIGDQEIDQSGQVSGTPVANPEEAGSAVQIDMQGFDVGDEIKGASLAAEQALQQGQNDVIQEGTNPIGTEDLQTSPDSVGTAEEPYGSGLEQQNPPDADALPEESAEANNGMQNQQGQVETEYNPQDLHKEQQDPTLPVETPAQPVNPNVANNDDGSNEFGEIDYGNED